MVSAIVQATKPAEAPAAADLSASRQLPVEASGCCGGAGCC
jgi:hypothetical protein